MVGIDPVVSCRERGSVHQDSERHKHKLLRGLSLARRGRKAYRAIGRKVPDVRFTCGLKGQEVEGHRGKENWKGKVWH